MQKIETGMILAAGFGKRLKPLTNDLPKPLLPIQNTCCLDMAIRALKENGLSNLVINAHHLFEKIVDHCSQDDSITVLIEEEILETGGGLLNALPHLGDAFIIVNGDIFMENLSQTICNMIAVFEERGSDNLLLMIPCEQALYCQSHGDYLVAVESSPHLRVGPITHKKFKKYDKAPYVFGGIQLWKREVILRALKQINPIQKAFSMTVFFDYFDKKNNLYGYVEETPWCDIGSKFAYDAINRLKQAKK